MSSAATAPTSTRKPATNSSADSNLAPLLRHFVGIDLIVETKQGRTFRGRLREADGYMNLVLSRTTAQSKESTSETFDWVHIRGPTIRYIVFGANIDITGVIKTGLDRERAAGDKYRRGIRKARK
ncbi:hypothetical protein ACHAXR_004293 [Thalassiosira sp. AJA248-18]